ncbi:hypothetical protein EDEG_03210 [Edhazardia aedis USNM 41457]|uniref:Uncharacterized protein n=1 Tax=Edhazardia aedis (strain USNM 41457) TaxID=1003232 RepID=J9D3C9_EDHAE|nr:hypothetical protein EDEG_03210 [Edhazardia aedis USNM 41457]|eukprot:EJW02351.1 hypothetical protein EDEG_03210 [Edhazardia aedis USNM 41457]
MKIFSFLCLLIIFTMIFHFGYTNSNTQNKKHSKHPLINSAFNSNRKHGNINLIHVNPTEEEKYSKKRINQNPETKHPEDPSYGKIQYFPKKFKYRKHHDDKTVYGHIINNIDDTFYTNAKAKFKNIKLGTKSPTKTTNISNADSEEFVYGKLIYEPTKSSSKKVMSLKELKNMLAFSDLMFFKKKIDDNRVEVNKMKETIENFKKNEKTKGKFENIVITTIKPKLIYVLTLEKLRKFRQRSKKCILKKC